MRRPDSEGFVTRDGVRTYYAVHGDGPQTLLLIPPWQISHGWTWRGNVDYLARYYRVLILDPRGNGRSDRPRGPEHYGSKNAALDALAVLDATHTEKAAIISYSIGSRANLRLCAANPDRIACSVFATPSVPLIPDPFDRRARFLRQLEGTPEGWDKFNANYWRENWPEFSQWFLEEACSDPHSWRGIELAVQWAADVDPQVMVDSILGDDLTIEQTQLLATTIKEAKIPTMVIAAEEDQIRSVEEARALSELLGANYVLAEGCGHPVHARYPIWFNLLMREFVDKATPFHERKMPAHTTWRRGLSRPKRVLYLSSPIGLGHARRDVAIASSLRELVPNLEVDWLTQSPVDKILGPRGEKMLAESKHLISEIDHFDAHTVDHCQPAFPVLRNMDTIMVNNFHVFLECMDAKQYDLVIADEGWEVDHFLHEHPEMKRAPFVWTTDVVGMQATAAPGEPFDPSQPGVGDRAYEERMVTDFNYEYISRLERFRHVRDLSLFIGEREDIPDVSLGTGLPTVRDHCDEFYKNSGYVLGFDPKVEISRRAEIREELGYGKDEKVVIVAVGGMAAGRNLLRKAIDAFPYVKRDIPGLRMIIVGGPRIAPESLYTGELPDGLEITGFVHNLYRHMAVCDLAVVHGGLTQTMDLTATGVPFIVIPYLRQFEQQIWVRHRLMNYGAMQYLDYRDLRKPEGPQQLAFAMTTELKKGHVRNYKPVADNALRAAKLIVPLL
ncbi:MAG: alpha/beta fold hydrolase [Kofleriaceae bacterium]|nr:alpha/beta fold hydrolase [Kofleriaceae bacterium]